MAGSSQAILQLDPPLYVETPLGFAQAYFLWTTFDDVQWCCFQLETGECWWWGNEEIRIGRSVSQGRLATSPIKISPEKEASLAPHRKRYRGG